MDNDDRTRKARIRDAAIALFAEHGVRDTTVRAVAVAAGLSPGLVIHHFGSKDNLRIECDRYVAGLIRSRKQQGMRAGSGLDPLAALKEQREGPPVLRYLARTLVDGTPEVRQIVDEMVGDAVEYMAEGVVAGSLRPTEYPYERAAVLTIWSLGALVLHEHLERLIGVDIVDPPENPTDAAAYVGPLLEIFTKGIVDPEVARRMKAVLVDDQPPEEGDEAR